MLELSKVFLHTGSNLGDCPLNLQYALEHIEQEIGPILLTSALYETEAWGGVDQQDFLNQAILIETTLSPLEVLQKTQAIEKLIGRPERIKWHARIIDIDILFYEDQIIDNEQLKIPHPYLHKRNFVLIPMLEIAPYFEHPIFKKDIETLYLESEDLKDVVMLD